MDLYVEYLRPATAASVMIRNSSFIIFSKQLLLYYKCWTLVEITPKIAFFFTQSLYITKFHGKLDFSSFVFAFVIFFVFLLVWSCHLTNCLGSCQILQVFWLSYQMFLGSYRSSALHLNMRSSSYRDQHSDN